MLGFTGGKPQKISLGNGCNGKGIAMHEMLHTLGFRHEQSRPDRDKYVEIFWENIKPGKKPFEETSAEFLFVFDFK